MKTTDHENLFKRYQSGEATPEEQAIVEDYILNNEFTPLYLTEAELEAVMLKLGKRIYEIPFSEKNEEVLAGVDLQGSKQKIKLPVWMASAAAVAAIVFGVWFFNSERGVLKQVQDDVAYKNDIKPGKNTATLRLANGKTIELSDAKTGVVIDAGLVRYSSGTRSSGSLKGEQSTTRSELVHSLASLEHLTVSTPRGGQYQVLLPDGSKVWLNAASSIAFPASFTGLKERKVELTGEAYFEVSKNKVQAFVVSSKNQDVTVLGTHFNVNTYEDEANTKTTLLEGSVKVSSSQGEALLKPNEQSILTAKGRIEVQDVDPADAVAWKNGEFMFSSEDIPTIMRKIARWYNVEVEYKGDVTKKRFTGTVSRYANVSEVLQTLELTKGIKFKIEERKIIVIN